MKKKTLAGEIAKRGSTCDELHKELVDKADIVIPLRDLGTVFFGAVVPYIRKVTLMKLEVEKLKETVVNYADQVRELRGEVVFKKKVKK